MIIYKYWSDYKHNSSDIKSINHLLNLLTSKEYKVNSSYLNNVSKNSRLLLAINSSDNKIVGMATLSITIIPTKKYGHIEDVVVDTDFQGQGIGKTLIKKIIIEAKKLKLVRVELTSNPTRIEANKMYQKLNFIKTETNVYRFLLPSKARLNVA
jgi:ribosomal protein S18 acetylase RimI-like enzyme